MEVVFAFGLGEAVDDAADGVPEAIGRAFGSLAQECLGQTIREPFLKNREFCVGNREFSPQICERPFLTRSPGGERREAPYPRPL